ncbi:MAG: NAD(P)/FAD-dependent oxidoreductase [Hydrogenibacillus schlegelii]|uniref:NAD(P)/FAD-dependent oxidoreductase n=1 Tax=Hydrogenibacillus schlegelii TaxID=1484 RepID=A0A947CYD8_HYDSH|nr:NAD(P)/FAD-dependent oxidoreductase [Hydrogenibacillus schlegelii]
MKYRIVIAGGGTAGITVSARLLRARRDLAGHIAIVEPSDVHYYQPLWTLVGAGLVPRDVTVRPQAPLIPKGATWIRDAVLTFLPDENRIVLTGGESIRYDVLIVAVGLKLDWDQVPGAREAIEAGVAGSNYTFDTVLKTWAGIRRLEEGVGLFTFPHTPIKCAGAPQKIMYLADDRLRQRGVRSRVTLRYVAATPSIYSVPKYAATLEKVARERGIETVYRHTLTAVDPIKREATFRNLESGETVAMRFDFLHIVPPMTAPDVVRESPLADAAGWVDVDKHTLQHTRYPNVFALGDVANVPTSKTGAAIRKQAPVLVENVLQVLRGEPLTARHNGYSSCPFVSGIGRLVLAEFGYDGEILESFPFDQAEERFFIYVLKKDLLPVIYWNGMLKGVL